MTRTQEREIERKRKEMEKDGAHWNKFLEMTMRFTAALAAALIFSTDHSFRQVFAREIVS